MKNSISTTVVEVTKNIHDTVIMASWRPGQWQSQPHDSLSQVVMKKTLTGTGYDVMVYVKMS